MVDRRVHEFVLVRNPGKWNKQGSASCYRNFPESSRRQQHATRCERDSADERDVTKEELDGQRDAYMAGISTSGGAESKTGSAIHCKNCTLIKAF